MNEKFLNLESEKRNRILQAAFEEFTEHTYDDASTNRIVKKAEISKGTLFYYFDNKKELYYYLVDYGVEFLQEQYYAVIENDTRDFIERCKLLAELDMKTFMEAPYIVEFFSKLYLNDDLVELPVEVKERLNLVLVEMFERLYDNVDYSLFRQDLPPEETMRMIKWIFDGYIKDLMTSLKGTDISFEKVQPHFEEFDKFLETLTKAFYK